MKRFLFQLSCVLAVLLMYLFTISPVLVYADIIICSEIDCDGIYGGDGNDIITVERGGVVTSEDTVVEEAIGVSWKIDGAVKGDASGKALSDSSVAVNAEAAGIDGRSRIDKIDNFGEIVADAYSSATAIGVSVDIEITAEGTAEGAALSDASVTSDAAATGIDGGKNADFIDNRGNTDLRAVSNATGVTVSLDIAGTMKGDTEGSPVSDASVTANATATGVDGGDGNDTIVSDGPEISADVDAIAIAVSVGLTVSGSMDGNVQGEALSDSSATADAISTGIYGGMGHDTIENWSGIYEEVDGSATTVGVGLDITINKEGNASGAALSDASVKANASASGIDGGGNGDEIDNRGDIELLSNSNATGVAVSLDIAGTMKGDTEGSSVNDASVTAKSRATGIEGGEGDDTIDNEGIITLMNGIGNDETDAIATAVSVGLTVSGSMEGNVQGEALSDSSARADAMGMGIEGGSGIDEITNRGGIVGNIDSSATAVGVAVDIGITEEGNALGAALSDASVTSNAVAIGIDGGKNADFIDNRGNTDLSAVSNATSVAVSLDVSGSVGLKGGVEGDIEGKALSNTSTEAHAETTGIDGGEDSDQIINSGDFSVLKTKSNATGVAASLNVSAGVAIKGDANIDVSGEAISDASVRARSTTTAINGAEGDDKITNSGNLVKLETESDATGVAASLDVAGSVAFKGGVEGEIEGKALSDTSVVAEALATGIEGGNNDDVIINDGDFDELLSTSDATGVAASLSTTTGVTFKDNADVNVTGGAVSNADVKADAMATGIDGGDGSDKIINTGDIAKLQADSTATGVAAGLNITSVLAIKGNADADVTGEAVGDSSVTAQAMALGLDGGLGDDEVENEGDINLLSTADATGVTAELNVSAALSFKGVSTSNVSGSAASDTSVFAKAEATGIDGGWGEDSILNSGNITLMANEDGFDADALGVSASLNVSGNVAIKGVAMGSVEGAAASNATVTAEAKATGIDGGGDNDIIGNTGTIKLLPSSSADGIAASLNLSGNMVGDSEGSASSDASVIATSMATGIDGGEGADIITNEGAITLMKQGNGEEVDAKALGVAASLDISGNLNGTAEGQAISKATTTAEAIATGIGGGGGQDTITNTATILADVDSEAEGVAVAADVTVTVNGKADGSSLSDVSSKSIASAFGIDGGEDNDVIDNEAQIQLFTDSEATSTAVAVTVGGSLRGTAEGEALSKANTTADACATGIEGGSGRDEINNRSTIFADVKSDANATAVSADVTFTGSGYAEGAALSDVSALSFALASGIDGGQGDDMLKNDGDLLLRSESESDATAVSVSLTVSMKGVAKGMAMADASSLAVSESAGIRGEEGADDIDNGANLADGMVAPSLQKITTDSQSSATANSVSVSGTASIGLSDGASVAESSATSEASSTGIDGGVGNDTINNIMEIEAISLADATANSTSVAFGISVGASGSSSLGDASATACANATGIEGGTDDDKIVNIATITAGVANDNLDPMATAQASSTAVDVGIAAGYTNREASANSSAFAKANAAGISGGLGNDWIENAGDITVGPGFLGMGGMANAGAESTTVDISVTVGASLGKSSSDTSSTAVVNLAGISGGSGNDTVYNSGTITTGTDPDETSAAMATAMAGSETVSVGLTVGGSFKDASSNTSATSHSKTNGIEMGLGADRVYNTGNINTFSSSEALGTAEAIKVSMTIGALKGAVESDASSLSTAVATGIDSGDDADEIDTNASFVVKALSVSTTTSNAEDLNILSIGSAIQSATANSSSTAEALARGIDGGTGGDTITVVGNYEVSADTKVFSTSRSSTVTGVSIGENKQKAQALAGTTSQALAVGIDGEEGNDKIHSTANLTVTTHSNAETKGTSSSNTGFNIAGSSSAESVAGATSDVTASGIGIRGGISVLDVNESDADVIINEGVIVVNTSVSAITNSTSTAESIAFIGKAEGIAVSDASATVAADGIGIDGGADNDVITSKNTIIVKTTADGSVVSTSNADTYTTFGEASSIGVSDASINVLAEATGICGGTGDDKITITSLAPVDVEAESIGSVGSTSNVDGKVTFGDVSSVGVSDASAEVTAEATGISGGTGSDIITSHALVDVVVKSVGDITAASYVNGDVTFGDASSVSISDASATKKGSATGIDGGDGGDVITNYDSLNVRAISAGTVTSTADASASSSFWGDTSSATSTSAALEGTVETAGIIGGSGEDAIINMGRVDSIADATLHVINSSVATSECDFHGKAEARAYSESTLQGKASSLGVSGDDGDDAIENEGVVNVGAIANVTVDVSTVAIAESFWGGEYTEAASSNYAAGVSTAEGVTAGAGNDEILNSALIAVEAGGLVTIDSAVYSSDGPASSDARTMALSHASGINSGADNDTVTNTETILVKATPRILSATRTFGMGGNVNGKVGIELAADAQGIAGGDGDDLITNEGDVLVFLGSQEADSTISENATSGETTFTDSNRIGEKPEAIVGKWVRIKASDGRNFVTSVEAFDSATGTFTLHSPIKYDLAVNDAYTLYDYGNKTADIEMVQVTVGGHTQVDASTTASIRATGIEGGDGNDEIMNSGALEVKANNLIKTVSVIIGNNINADLDTESTVNTIGIAGDGKEDTSTVTEDSESGTATFIDTGRIGENPDAIVGKRIHFKTGEYADFFTTVEEFDPETGVFTLHDPIPESGLSQDDIYVFGGGSNAVTNLGEIDVESDSAIDASGWVLEYWGSSDIDSEGRTQALAAGIRGGEYDDYFKNTGHIKTQSNADVSSDQRAKVYFGETDQELTFEAVSNSAGISAGDGNDEIVNMDSISGEPALVDVNATSIAHVNGVTTTTKYPWPPFGGVISTSEMTNNLVDASSVSTATGFDLGKGQDVAYNAGQIKVASKSTTTAIADSDFDYADEANARANAAATASASGISAEDGGDIVQSNGLLTIDATASADSFARGSDVIGGTENDFNSVVTADSPSESTTFIDASLIPELGEDPADIVGQYVRFLTGENEDFTTQVTDFDSETGEVTIFDPLPVALKAVVIDKDDNIVTPGDEYTIANGRDGESGAFANAFATGIDLNNGLDNGDSMVEIAGNLNVWAYAQANSNADASYNENADASAIATAQARGIVTGNGNDIVENTGVIRVGSMVDTQTSGDTVKESANAMATGINTGAGDDTIMNRGSIITEILLNGAPPLSGVGILAGAGNDEVILTDGSLVDGSIDLGENEDILKFIGDVQVTGEITGNGGTDSIILQNAGVSIISHLDAVEGIELNDGTLQINSDLQLTDKGYLQTKINNNGINGQLLVVGEVSLAGTMDVIAAPYAYRNGETFDVISALDIVDKLDTVNLPTPTPLLRFETLQFSDLWQIEVTTNSFTIVATNPVEKAIAISLDTILPTSAGDLSNVLGTFQLLSKSDDFTTAFSSLSPDSYDNATRITFEVTQQYTKTVQHRMNAIRANLYTTGKDTQAKASSTRSPLLLSYKDSNAGIGDLLGCKQQVQLEKTYGFWLDGFGFLGDQDKEGSFTGFDYQVLGTALGFDHVLTDRMIAGVSVGDAYTDIDLDTDEGDGTIHSIGISVYGSYFTDRAFIEGLMSYTKQNYANDRNIMIGSIRRTANSDHDGNAFSAILSGGYNFHVNDWTIGPFSSLQYIYLDEESFKESGAGSINLKVDDRQTEFLASELGLRLAREFKTDNGNLIPEISASWSHDFDVGDRDITSSFTSSPDASFTIEGLGIKRNGASFGAGVTFIHKNGFTTSLNYNGEFREDFDGHSIIGVIRFLF